MFGCVPRESSRLQISGTVLSALTMNTRFYFKVWVDSVSSFMKENIIDYVPPPNLN